MATIKITGKKISELGERESITGDELIPCEVNGENRSIKAKKIMASGLPDGVHFGPDVEIGTGVSIQGSPSGGVDIQGPLNIGTRGIETPAVRIGIGTDTEDSELVGADTIIYKGVKIGGTTRIGGNTSIAGNTTIYGNAYIGTNARIEEDAEIGYSVYIGKGARIGSAVNIDDSVIIGSCNIGYNVNIANNAHIFTTGEGCLTIGSGIFISDYVKIGTHANIGIIGVNSLREEAVFIAPTVSIGNYNDNPFDLTVTPNVLIGSQVNISHNVGIAGHVTIGSQVYIGGHVHIGESAKVDDTVYIANVEGMGPDEIMQKSTVIGTNVIIGTARDTLGIDGMRGKTVITDMVFIGMDNALSPSAENPGVLIMNDVLIGSHIHIASEQGGVRLTNSLQNKSILIPWDN